MTTTCGAQAQSGAGAGHGSSAGAGAVDAVVVVVPVHDEEELLPRCLEALDAARQALARDVHPAPTVAVVVVLDACTDASERVVRGHPVTLLRTEHACVGAARAAGVEEALELVRPVVAGLDRVWVASTDADSAVPENWLVEQVRLAGQGADLMIGTVRPDPRDLTPAQRAAWTATHTPGLANGHVHGANLGIRGSVYRAAGGYAAAPEHEDVLLVESARRAGAQVVASDVCWVLTSGRPVGRTPGGYARYLREDLVPSGASGQT